MSNPTSDKNSRTFQRSRRPLRGHYDVGIIIISLIIIA